MRLGLCRGLQIKLKLLKFNLGLGPWIPWTPDARGSAPTTANGGGPPNPPSTFLFIPFTSIFRDNPETCIQIYMLTVCSILAL